MNALPRPPYDSELVALQEAQLAEVAARDPQLADRMRQPYSITLNNLAQIRASTTARDNATRQELGSRLEELDVEHFDVTYPGLDGDPDVTVAIFRSRKIGPSAPSIFWVHGGGMLFGDRFGLETGLIEWVAEHGVVLASVEYRLAPQNPDPAPLHDVYAGLLGFAAAHEELGLDPDRILLGGGSAGGGLAAGAALLLRDKGGPRLAGQLLVCPMLDDRNESLSSRQFSNLGVWSRESNETGWTALLSSRRATSEVTQYSAPARATDLSGLPATFIDVGSAEVFRDEDVAYASAIWAAGGEAELHVWPGGYHGFHGAAPTTSIARRANRARQEWVFRILGL